MLLLFTLLMCHDTSANKFGFVMQKAARYGFNILLGGVCALVVVIFLRFVSRMLLHVLWFTKLCTIFFIKTVELV